MSLGLRPHDALIHSQRRWPTDVLPLLETYARIPNQSPAYDAQWESAGHMEAAADLFAAWARARAIPGAVVEVVRIPGLTSTVLVDVPASHCSASRRVRKGCSAQTSSSRMASIRNMP